MGGGATISPSILDKNRQKIMFFYVVGSFQIKVWTPRLYFWESMIQLSPKTTATSFPRKISFYSSINFAYSWQLKETERTISSNSLFIELTVSSSQQYPQKFCLNEND